MPSTDANGPVPPPAQEPSRPSLVTASAKLPHAQENTSILKALERVDHAEASAMTQNPQGGRKVAWKVAGVGLVLAAGLAWTQWGGPANTPAALSVAQAGPPASAASTPGPLAAVAPAMAKNQASSSAQGFAPAESASAAASAMWAGAGVHNPLAALADQQADAPATPSGPGHGAVVEGKAVSPAMDALSVASGTAARAIQPRQPVAAAAGVTAEERARAKAAKTAREGQHKKPEAAAKGARPGAATPARAASGAASAHDPDVEIVSALMAGNSTRRAAAETGRSKQGGSTPENIAGLVNACKSQRGSESLACQAHICQGYWGKAQACPKRARKAAERAALARQARVASSPDEGAAAGSDARQPVAR